MVGYVDGTEEGTGGDGGSGDGVHVAAVLGDGQLLLTGVLADDVALLTLLEPEAGLGAEARGLSMFEDGVALDGSNLVEADKNFQFAAEAVGVDGLHGHTFIGGVEDDGVAVGVLGFGG